MGKYLLKRLLHGVFSVVCVVTIIMLLIYVLMDRNLIFASDEQYTKKNNNNKTLYKYQRWEDYGYLDYVNYNDYIASLTSSGELDSETASDALKLGNTSDSDSSTVQTYTAQFTEYYESMGYTVERLDAVVVGRRVADGGSAALIAYKDIPLFTRVVTYFTSLIEVDDINYASEVEGERGLTFTLYDPLYGGSFAPAVIGNGTYHKYLIYFDSTFPYIHQNIFTIQLGTSYSVNKGVDVFKTMTVSQGGYVLSEVTYPTGLVEQSADNLHSATYSQGSRDGLLTNQARFEDDYTSVDLYRDGRSRMGYSFLIGIIATIISYCLGLPLGVMMARNKDGILDKIGTVYIIFIIAVPSLAYIFMFKAIGGALGLPTTFSVSAGWQVYVLPIISLALPSIAGLMRWGRRYMIDQMNSDYVKFARSSGLTENEIFSKHILKNAVIPIVHGVPGSVLGALTGAIITERVYSVPGTGGLLTNAISAYDNGVIVGMSFFYAILSIISVMLGDVLMAAVDPRISYTTKSR